MIDLILVFPDPLFPINNTYHMGAEKRGRGGEREGRREGGEERGRGGEREGRREGWERMICQQKSGA